MRVCQIYSIKNLVIDNVERLAATASPWRVMQGDILAPIMPSERIATYKKWTF